MSYASNANPLDMNSLYTECLDIWYDFYLYRENTKPVHDGKQGRHLKELLKKIIQKTVEAGVENITEATIQDNFSLFLHCIKDEWILS